MPVSLPQASQFLAGVARGIQEGPAPTANEVAAIADAAAELRDLPLTAEALDAAGLAPNHRAQLVFLLLATRYPNEIGPKLRLSHNLGDVFRAILDKAAVRQPNAPDTYAPGNLPPHLIQFLESLHPPVDAGTAAGKRVQLPDPSKLTVTGAAGNSVTLRSDRQSFVFTRAAAGWSFSGEPVARWDLTSLNTLRQALARESAAGTRDPLLGSLRRRLEESEEGVLTALEEHVRSLVATKANARAIELARAETALRNHLGALRVGELPKAVVDGIAQTITGADPAKADPAKADPGPLKHSTPSETLASAAAILEAASLSPAEAEAVLAAMDGIAPDAPLTFELIGSLGLSPTQSAALVVAALASRHPELVDPRLRSAEHASGLLRQLAATAPAQATIATFHASLGRGPDAERPEDLVALETALASVAGAVGRGEGALVHLRETSDFLALALKPGADKAKAEAEAIQAAERRSGEVDIAARQLSSAEAALIEAESNWRAYGLRGQRRRDDALTARDNAALAHQSLKAEVQAQLAAAQARARTPIAGLGPYLASAERNVLKLYRDADEQWQVSWSAPAAADGSPRAEYENPLSTLEPGALQVIEAALKNASDDLALESLGEELADALPKLRSQYRAPVHPSLTALETFLRFQLGANRVGETRIDALNELIASVQGAQGALPDLEPGEDPLQALFGEDEAPPPPQPAPAPPPAPKAVAPAAPTPAPAPAPPPTAPAGLADMGQRLRPEFSSLIKAIVALMANSMRYEQRVQMSLRVQGGSVRWRKSS
jgi:hypothetical protein